MKRTEAALYFDMCILDVYCIASGVGTSRFHRELAGMEDSPQYQFPSIGLPRVKKVEVVKSQIYNSIAIGLNWISFGKVDLHSRGLVYAKV